MFYKSTLISILLLMLSNHSYAMTCDSSLSNGINLPTLIQEHTVSSAGRPVTSDATVGRYTHHNCVNTSGVGKIELHINAPQAPSMANGIFSTPIPGLGFKIKISPTVMNGDTLIHLESNCTYNYPTSKIQTICTVDYNKEEPGKPISVWGNITYIFYQTASTIQPGSTVSTKIAELRLYNGNGEYKSNDILFNASTLTMGTCSLSNDSINVKMPRADAKYFTGVGSISSEGESEAKFNIPLNCNNGTRVNIQIDGNTEDADQGILKLSSESNAASGVGIQLRYNEAPVKIGTLTFIGTIKKAGVFNIPMSARYIQTKDQIKPGKANSTATFTLKYK